MKQIFIVLAILASIFGSATEALAITEAKSSKKTETLNYDIFYHWGLIWKKAGCGSLNLLEETDIYGNKRMHGQVFGRSLSFIEYFMAVRDTLECWYTPEYVPIEYCKRTHEGSYKAIERNIYTTSFKDGGTGIDDIENVQIKIDRWRNKKGRDQKTYTSSKATYDYLSIFYRIRSLDFSKINPGTTISLPVVSGVKIEQMKVKFIEETTCKLDKGKKYPAYKIELRFNVKGEDGAPLYVWLTKDEARVPLCVVIHLKRVGSIQCEIANY